MEDKDIVKLKPIAVVKNEISEPGRHNSTDVLSDIIFDPGFEEALDRLDEFSHIVVIYWMHRSPAWDHSLSKVHPRKRVDLPLVGVLATRSPVRPNSLGITVVRLLERQGNVLKTRGLDAIDGTPVIDVKPYLPPDLNEPVKIADWLSDNYADIPFPNAPDTK